MMVNVDIERSVNRRRLSLKDLDFAQWLNVLFYVILAAILAFTLIVYPIWFIIRSYILAHGNFNALMTLVLVIALTGGFLLAYGLIYEDRFIVVEGRDPEINKAIMLKILKDRFNSDSINISDQLITYYQPSDLWHFALRLVIIFDGRDVLIDVSRFNQLGVKGFLHPFFSRRFIAKKIAGDLKNEIAVSDQQN